MRFGVKAFVKLKGLNRRVVSVDPQQVQYLEEHEIDGTMVTNVHFTNGKWVTVGLPHDEAHAELSADVEEKVQTEEEKKHEQEKLNRYRETARARAEINREIEETLKQIGPNLKAKSYSKEEFADGSGKLTVFYEPREKKVDGTVESDV